MLVHQKEEAGGDEYTLLKIHERYHSPWNGIILKFTTSVSQFLINTRCKKMFVAKIDCRIATNGSIVMRWAWIKRRELDLSKDG